ncbi:O-methyltransferase [Halomicrobium urmianum]|uniref:O-methyltransferase n=1 Tax=Halomicrobium urmianum TaxID=1586233 RepID=UPI0035715224
MHTDAVDRLLSTTSPETDEVLDEMEAQADREGFPTIGHEVGAALRLCARLTDADSVFELGSGFGYSAYWMAPAVGPDGEIVLTEVDEDELDQARAYFERGGYADRAVFEHGDALDVVAEYDGPFDLVLVDHQNERYVEGFEAVREKVAPGGVVVADNVLHSSGDPGFEPEDLERALEDGPPEDDESSLASIIDYYRRVHDDPDFETTTVPVGEGLFVSVRV